MTESSEIPGQDEQGKIPPPSVSSSETPQPAKKSPPKELSEPRGRTFSIINQKGGCGKTTTAINLAAALARQGFQVLLIDLDAQTNATLGLGIRLEPDARTVYDLFKNPELLAAELVHTTALDSLQVLPGSRLLSSLAVELLRQSNWEYLLRSILRPLKPAFHYILIDCPPALNALTINALTASEDMVIPIQTHYFSLEGMKELFLTVRSVRERLNPLLGKGRILATLFDKRTKMNCEMLQSIRDYFKEQVFETAIRNNIKLVESVMHGLPVMVYDPRSRGAEDYEGLSREMVQKELEALLERVDSRALF